MIETAANTLCFDARAPKPRDYTLSQSLIAYVGVFDLIVVSREPVVAVLLSEQGYYASFKHLLIDKLRDFGLIDFDSIWRCLPMCGKHNYSFWLDFLSDLTSNFL